MAISAQQLAKSLFAALNDNPDNQRKITKAFFDFVDEKKLLPLLPYVVDSLERMQKVDKDRITLKITLQKKHSQLVIDQIKKKIKTPDNVDVNVDIDESIRGGFIAQYDNVVYDGSVATQLGKAEKKLLS